MKIKALLLIFSSVVFWGCISPMEKSVLEPLSSKELDRVAGKDISFLATYSIVEEKSNYIHTPEDSSRWRTITYNRLHSYLRTIESAELNSPLFAQLRKKWEYLYNNHNNKVDSLLYYWNSFINKYSPDSLLKVSFEGVEIERIRNLNKHVDTLIKVRIKLKTTSFTADSLRMIYSFSPYEDSLFVNTVFHKRRIKDSAVIKVFPYLVPQLKRALAANDNTLEFKYSVMDVYSDGKCYNTETIQSELPKSVLQYFLAKKEYADSHIFDGQFYREKIIRELIDPAFISQSAYIKVNAEDYYKQIDSLVFSYTNLQ